MVFFWSIDWLIRRSYDRLISTMGFPVLVRSLYWIRTLVSWWHKEPVHRQPWYWPKSLGPFQSQCNHTQHVPCTCMWMSSWDHFTYNFSITIQMWWKFHCTLMHILTKWSLQNFAHGTTAVLWWHVHNFVAIWWSGDMVIELLLGEVSIEFELWANNDSETGPWLWFYTLSHAFDVISVRYKDKGTSLMTSQWRFRPPSAFLSTTVRPSNTVYTMI